MSNSKIIHRIKTLPHIFPQNITFFPRFSMLLVDSVFFDIVGFLKNIVKYSYGGGARGAD